jgi:hypothetical protein
MHVPGRSGPSMMRHRNIYSYFMQREGGRLYGIAKTGQQEYDATLILYGENPSVAIPMRTFHASLAKSMSKSSRAFHASLSDTYPVTQSPITTSLLSILITSLATLLCASSPPRIDCSTFSFPSQNCSATQTPAQYALQPI